MVESALVYSLTLMLVLGTIVVGLGIFRYQQVASLAREGSRWAAVHGPKYETEQNQPRIASQDVRNSILPKAMILNTSPTVLQCTLDPTQWNSGTASVKVTYVWTPEAFFAPITFSSTSVTPILY